MAKKTTKQKKQKRNTMFVDSIPPALRKRFKMACVRNDLSMKVVLARLLEDYAVKAGL